MVIPVSVKRPFRSRPKMVRPLAGITVRQKSERVSDRNRNQCPTETGMPVRQRPVPVSVGRHFRSARETVRQPAGITVRQKSERVSDRNRNQCPTETGMPVRQRPEYAPQPEVYDSRSRGPEIALWPGSRPRLCLRNPL